MQSSESSDSPKIPEIKETGQLSRLGAFAIKALRLILGGVFVFSGFVKAVDPWGGLYKMTDYFGAWGVAGSHEAMLTLACLLASFEFILGVMIIIGAYRRATRWLTPAFMSFMTILTLYIWIADPVSDCGCFGDAFVISNSLSFWKNVVLLTMSFVYARYNGRLHGLITPRLQWFGLVVTGAYIIAVEIYGYHIQPMIDFRPFPLDTNLTAMAENDDVADVLFVYERDGVQQEFTADSLPDESWTFVGRKEADRNEREESSVAFFDGDEDVTEWIISDSTPQFILLVSDVDRFGMSRSDMTDRLYEYALDNGYDMFAVIAATTEQRDKWRELTGARFPVYTADDTDIKMMARGDAALMALVNGRIIWKTNIYALPPEFPDNDNPLLTDGWVKSGKKALFTFTLLWLISMVVTVAVSQGVGNIRRHLHSR